jgi:hypothetical protein
MRRGNLRSGLTCAGISAVFLVAGVLLGKMTRRPPGRGGLR